MGKIIGIIFLVIAILCAAYFVCVGLSSWEQGYTMEEMDWSEKGSTSIADFFAASDIGKREIQINGTTCIEFFAYKDARPIKVVCPKP